MINDFDITTIEDEVMAIVRNLGVSKKVYPNRPKAADPATDFVVVGVDGLEDYSAYGECTVSIDLFAKDIDSVKNRKKLSFLIIFQTKMPGNWDSLWLKKFMKKASILLSASKKEMEMLFSSI